MKSLTKRLTIFLLLPALLLPGLPCFGAQQPAADNFILGRQFFLSGQYREAGKHLYEAFRQDPANPDINFYLGRNAFELGDYETALMAFERILFTDPDAVRIKLEIARCHERLGFKEMAKQYFREVLATNPPEPVWRNIERHLALIAEQEKRHVFNGTFTVGFNLDDNVYLSPVSDILSIGNLEIILTGDSAAARHDEIFSATTVLNHLYRLEDQAISWKSTLTNYNAFYDTYHDLDINYYEATTGPIWKTDRFLWNNFAIAKHIAVEHDRYLTAFGLGTQLTLAINPQLLLSVGGRLENKENHPYPLRDATNFVISLNPVFSLGPNRISLLIFQETDNADADFYSYDRIGCMLNYERVLPWWGISAFAGAGYQETDYDATDPFFHITRSDRLEKFKGGISKLLWQSPTTRTNLSGQLSYAYEDSDSNMDLYTYRKNLAALSFTIGFF